MGTLHNLDGRQITWVPHSLCLCLRWSLYYVLGLDNMAEIYQETSISVDIIISKYIISFKFKEWFLLLGEVGSFEIFCQRHKLVTFIGLLINILQKQQDTLNRPSNCCQSATSFFLSVKYFFYRRQPCCCSRQKSARSLWLLWVSLTQSRLKGLFIIWSLLLSYYTRHTVQIKSDVIDILPEIQQ